MTAHALRTGPLHTAPARERVEAYDLAGAALRWLLGRLRLRAHEPLDAHALRSLGLEHEPAFAADRALADREATRDRLLARHAFHLH